MTGMAELLRDHWAPEILYPPQPKSITLDEVKARIEKAGATWGAQAGWDRVYATVWLKDGTARVSEGHNLMIALSDAAGKADILPRCVEVIRQSGYA